MRLLLLIFVLTLSATAQQWPKVAPFERRITIADVSKDIVQIDIRRQDGPTAYQLQCASPQSAKRHRLLDFDWSGDFECRLWSPSDSRYATLLTYDPNPERDWESRGRFFLEELEMPCGDYPEWGRTRTFRLRGLELTLQIMGFARVAEGYSGNPITSLVLKIKVDPDADAISAIAGEITIRQPHARETDSPRPKYDCRRVLYQHVPGRLTERYLSSFRKPTQYQGIRRISKEFVFDVEAIHRMVIRATNGSPAYYLECESVPNGIRTAMAAIDCRLVLPGSKQDLLGDSVDPISLQRRSRINLQQTVGECAAHPAWGRTREFRLRNMKLRIVVENKQQVSQPASVTLHIEARPDNSANGAVALPAKYLDPSYMPLDQPNACMNVLSRSQ